MMHGVRVDCYHYIVIICGGERKIGLRIVIIICIYCSRRQSHLNSGTVNPTSPSLQTVFEFSSIKTPNWAVANP